MREDFLHYVWSTRQYHPAALKTTTGELVEVLRTGELNFDSGPDFFNARIRIGGTLWAGNVEIHLRSSDWMKHRHQHDAAYDNIILHVVFEDDMLIRRSTGEPVPTLVLGKHLSENQYHRYLKYRNSKEQIPCRRLIADTPAITITGWTERLLVERLERKSAFVFQHLDNSFDNWEDGFYLLFVRHFGMKINDEPFALLARSTPQHIIVRKRKNLLQVEALLFGQAGLIPEKPVDEYSELLRREYRILKKQFSLKPMPGHLWKFMRMRPVNFPTVRIAQLAALLSNMPNLATNFLNEDDAGVLMDKMDVQASAYWTDHYRFGVTATPRVKSIGRQAAQNLLINTVVPFLFVYGRRRNEEIYVERALRLLEQLEPENNATMDLWKKAGLTLQSAFDTQALLQLKNEYCKPRRCLNCAIGHHIFRTCAK